MHTSKNTPKKICYILSEATSAFYDLGVLQGEIEFFGEKNWDIIIICGNKTKINKNKIHKKCQIKYVNMKREPDFLLDLVALIKILIILIKEKPSISCYVIPKSAFIGAIASRMACVPTRVYLLMAAKFETSTGIKRKILIFLEKLVINTSTKVLCVSESLRRLYHENMVLNHPNVISVIGKGSASGVDFEYFNSNLISEESQALKKKELEILSTDFVIGFVGRINKDKGVKDLIESVKEIRKSNTYDNLKLVLVGKFDSNNFIDEKYIKLISELDWIKHVNFTEDIRSIYKCINIFVLPTYREGFPSVILEAYAMKIPVITSNATGAIDSVVENITGLIFPVANVTKLKNSILELIQNTDKRNLIAENGYKWAYENFNKNKIVEEIYNFYINGNIYE